MRRPLSFKCRQFLTPGNLSTFDTSITSAGGGGGGASGNPSPRPTNGGGLSGGSGGGGSSGYQTPSPVGAGGAGNTPPATPVAQGNNAGGTPYGTPG